MHERTRRYEIENGTLLNIRSSSATFRSRRISTRSRSGRETAQQPKEVDARLNEGPGIIQGQHAAVVLQPCGEGYSPPPGGAEELTNAEALAPERRGARCHRHGQLRSQLVQRPTIGRAAPHPQVIGVQLECGRPLQRQADAASGGPSERIRGVLCTGRQRTGQQEQQDQVPHGRSRHAWRLDGIRHDVAAGVEHLQLM